MYGFGTKQLILVSAMSKGGARRKVVDEICHEHLADTLKTWARNSGAAAFKFGAYDHAKRTGGTLGPELAAIEPFVIALMDVSRKLEFKYSDLKGAMLKIFVDIPDCRKPWPQIQDDRLAGDIAKRIMTLCTHTRRFKGKNGELRLREACTRCTSFQMGALRRLREALLDEDTNVGASSSLEDPAQDDPLPTTQELLSLQIESSQDVAATPMEDAEGDEEAALLEAALKNLPVPPRKQTLKEEMGVLKKPAAAKKTIKKPAAAENKEFKNQVFESKSFGKCKAEFYTHKSYIRQFCETTGKLHLVIQCEGCLDAFSFLLNNDNLLTFVLIFYRLGLTQNSGDGHAAKLQNLISHAKLANMSKEKLVQIRSNL